MGGAQVLAYAFNLVLSRSLGPAAYGSAAALLGLVLVGSVPSMALQSVVARRIASHPGPRSELLALRYGVWVGVVVAVAVALAAPFLTGFLRLGSAFPVLVVAASLAPFALTSAAQGLLQGSERFARLAVVFVAAAALRLVCGAAGVVLGYGVNGAIVGTAIAAALSAMLAVPLTVGRFDLVSACRFPFGLSTELGHVVLAVGGLLVLANIDVLLARHYLPAAEAGLYAVGALAARATYWAPQFVSVSVFSRLTDRQARRRLLPRSLALVAAMGAAATLLAALVARPVLTGVFGDRYAELAPSLWWFAMLGSLQAVVQLLIASGIASADRLTPLLVWSAVVVELVLVATLGHGSLLAIVVCATATAACLVAGLALRAAAGLRRSDLVDPVQA